MINSRTYIAITPGATIKELIHNSGFNKKEFAAQIDIKRNQL